MIDSKRGPFGNKALFISNESVGGLKKNCMDRIALVLLELTNLRKYESKIKNNVKVTVFIQKNLQGKVRITGMKILIMSKK